MLRPVTQPPASPGLTIRERPTRPDFRPMGVAEDDQVVFPAGRRALDRAVQVGDEDFHPLVGESEGGFPDRPERLRSSPSSPSFSPSQLPKTALTGTRPRPGLWAAKGATKSPAWMIKPAAGVPEKADGPPDGVQIVVGIRQNPDHARIIPAIAARLFRPAKRSRRNFVLTWRPRFH